MFPFFLSHTNYVIGLREQRDSKKNLLFNWTLDVSAAPADSF